MSVEISYQLVGTGWSECTVHVGDAHAKASASYSSNALEDLVTAVAAALRGHPRPTASFAEEPGEYRWVFEPTPDGLVTVRILEFQELWGDRPDDEGKEIFSAQCRLRTFAGALLSELQRLERTHGLKGYREKWVKHEFPKDRMAELEGLLKTGHAEDGI